MPSRRTADRDLDYIAERLRPLGDLEVTYARGNAHRWTATIRSGARARGRRIESGAVGWGETPLEAAQSLVGFLTTGILDGEYIEATPDGDRRAFVWDGIRFREIPHPDRRSA